MALGTQSATVGGVTKSVIVATDINGNVAAAHVAVSAAGAELLVALDGTDATGVTIPAGGTGIRGWLSGIYARLGGTLTVAFGGSLPTGTNTIGAVNVVGTVPVSAAALPLPTGAALDATLQAINTTLASLLAAERPYAGVIPMTVGTPIAAQRAIQITCTGAGNVSLTYADGSTAIIPVNAGLSIQPGAITTVNSSGTTATATYAALK